MFHGDKKETKEKRSFLYENLPALNRVSLGAALGRFFERYQIIHDHLWPVVSDGPQWSLAKIRNKIAHGEPFTESEWGDVALAAEHIRWISERMVLSLLEWPLEKSRVNCFYAEEMARLNDWAAARERLSGL